METLPEPTAIVENVEDNEKILKEIRRDWKWAAASDFLYKFNPMLRLDFLDLADVEHDIIHGSSETIMSVFLKILHVLTSIRGLSHDTWEMYLRRLYARRVPENRVWGTEEEPIAWKDFTWQDRLDVLYSLTEWLFQAPLKVRQAMKDDSDDASWRSAPIGRDAKKNEYWHLGRDRLWILRPTDKPEPEIRELKRKRVTTKRAPKPSKRKVLENGTKSTSAKAKAKPKEIKPKDAKPKEKGHAKKSSQSSGTRTRSRLTRGEDGDGWQKVPEEWLQEPPASSSPATTDKEDVEALFDDDLSELSDDDKQDGSEKDESSDSELTDLDEEDEDDKKDEDVKMETDPKDDGEFVEFETICITMSEWKGFAERFKITKSHNERRLYRWVTQIIIPEMEQWQEALDEKQKKELKDMLKREQAAAAAAAAESRPKRSSRLAAVGEQEKGQGSQGSADGDSSDWGRGGRFGRTRRAAARGARWFAEHQESLADTPDSQEGEQDGDGDEKADGEKITRRRRDRSGEEDYQEDDFEAVPPPPPEPEVNALGRTRRAAAVKADLQRPKPVARRRRHRSDSEDGNESDEPFFLNCEICKRSGWNQDDSQHLIACQDCGIWQHMSCHDRADKMEGRPKRNWGAERFLCSLCVVKAQNKRPKRGRKAKEAVTDDNMENGDANAVSLSQLTIEASQATLPPSSQVTVDGSSQDQVVDTTMASPTVQQADPLDTPIVPNGFQAPLNGTPLASNGLNGSNSYQQALVYPQSSSFQLAQPQFINQVPPSQPLMQQLPIQSHQMNGFSSPANGFITQQQFAPFGGAPNPTANGIHQVSQPSALPDHSWSHGQLNGNIQAIPGLDVQQPLQHPQAYPFNQPPQ